jgi:hypothetical protein
VAKFTYLIPLSLLILCKISFLIVGLEMSSLRTLVLGSLINDYLLFSYICRQEFKFRYEPCIFPCLTVGYIKHAVAGNEMYSERL